MGTDPSEAREPRLRAVRDVVAAALAGAIVLILCVVLNLPAHVRGLSR